MTSLGTVESTPATSTDAVRESSFVDSNASRIVIALLSCHAVLLGWGAYLHSPTFDEVAYLPAGVSHWELGRFDLASVSPPLVRLMAAIPVVLSEHKTEWRHYDISPSTTPAHAVGRDFTVVNGERTFWLFTIARWACIPFSLIGGYVCYAWARALYGSLSGVLACGLWCFSPNMLAHAQLMTPDVGTTALGVAAAYTFWRWLTDPNWGKAFVAGFVLGLAELAKTTLVVFFALWPLLWLVSRVVSRRFVEKGPGLGELSRLWAMLVLALYLLNMGYGFQGSAVRVRDYTFISHTLAGDQRDAEGGNRLTEWGLGAIPVPFPRNYIIGLDSQKRQLENRNGRQKSYLAGEWRSRGWWYYYLYALAIKVPLGTWTLLLLAIFVRPTVDNELKKRIGELVILTPLLLILTLVSAQTGFNHHMRYALPIFPFAFVFISRVASRLGARPVWFQSVVTLAALWSLASSLWVYPHSLSYFNELVGGPKGGHAHLIDSNIDWGQDLLLFREWLHEHPEATPIRIAYFGNIDPKIAGVEASRPPGGGPPTAGETDFPVTPSRDLSPCDYGPQPGWYAVSVNYLRGVTWNTGLNLTYFQHFEPVDHVGNSILIYQITQQDAERVRQMLGLPALESCTESEVDPH